MATYAIGDLQGCYDELMDLLNKIQFSPSTDRLWFVGDIINRGPKSLACLRFIHELGDGAITVLGNHDLHLLAVVFGQIPHKSYDTFDDILSAPDCFDLCHWLRARPLLHHDARLGFTMAHAGIFPEWTLSQAQCYANEVEQVLQSEQYQDFLTHMYGDYPDHWQDSLKGYERRRFITNCFTRMRLCGPGDKLNLRKKGPPSEGTGYIPWFRVPNRVNKELKIVFGHWAALECHVYGEPNIYALDSGCVWGLKLTAMRLEDEKRFEVPSKQPKKV